MKVRLNWIPLENDLKGYSGSGHLPVDFHGNQN